MRHTNQSAHQVWKKGRVVELKMRMRRSVATNEDIKQLHQITIKMGKPKDCST